MVAFSCKGRGFCPPCLGRKQWVPTFPNARYVMAKREYDHWNAVYARDKGKPDNIHALAFEDSVLPLVERFVGYRETWLQQGIATLLRRWMTEEQVAARLLARSDGPRRLTNLLHLAELLHQASSEHAAPEALLQWLADRKSVV